MKGDKNKVIIQQVLYHPRLSTFNNQTVDCLHLWDVYITIMGIHFCSGIHILNNFYPEIPIGQCTQGIRTTTCWYPNELNGKLINIPVVNLKLQPGRDSL